MPSVPMTEWFARSTCAAMYRPPSSCTFVAVSGIVRRQPIARMRHSISTMSSSQVTTGWSPKVSGSFTRFGIAAYTHSVIASACSTVSKSARVCTSSAVCTSMPKRHLIPARRAHSAIAGVLRADWWSVSAMPSMPASTALRTISDGAISRFAQGLRQLWIWRSNFTAPIIAKLGDERALCVPAVCMTLFLV